MKVLVLGATGLIGSAVASELSAHDHSVFALARNKQSEKKLCDQHFHVVRGDIRDPGCWIDVVRDVDCVVHAAATFTPDMGAIDRQIVAALIAASENRPEKLRLIYTGGCWLYGDTADHVAVEGDRLDPIPAFSWMVENGELAQNSDNLDTVIIHPGMVYERDGGVLARYKDTANQNGQVEVWGSLETHWPMVQRTDLAQAYRLGVEIGIPGESYNVSTQVGVRVGDMVERIANRFQVKHAPLVLSADEVVHRYGDWALGPMLDQQMGSEKIRSELGWTPIFTDILQEIS